MRSLQQSKKANPTATHDGLVSVIILFFAKNPPFKNARVSQNNLKFFDNFAILSIASRGYRSDERDA